MKITLTSIFVDDQEKALQFYTKTLGFQKKLDIPAGKYRWITVTNAQEENGIQLLLEPNDNPAAQNFQQSLFEQGIPSIAFESEDIQSEYLKLVENGVEFIHGPSNTGSILAAVFDDTCGNLIEIYQLLDES